MISTEKGRVLALLARRKGLSEVLVSIKGSQEKAKALNFEEITGSIKPGDQVILNTTAVRLKLGTGGYHLVCFNYNHPTLQMSNGGHIMKLRYTPYQLKVLSCEEEGNHRQEIENFISLEASPIIIGELHSMLVPAVLSLKEFCPSIRIGYVMTDSASLSLSMSRTVYQLKEKNLLQVSISCGQAFGGDLEAVNIYTGIIAAFQIARVDVVMVAAGPGVVGTATRFGFSGMELGENINRVHALGGMPIVIPRLSFRDSRFRHQGISHHTLTPLSLPQVLPAHIPLPPLNKEGNMLVMDQLAAYNIFERHQVSSVISPDPVKLCRDNDILMKTMGRDASEDPVFFKAATAAGRLAAMVAKSLGKIVYH